MDQRQVWKLGGTSVNTPEKLSKIGQMVSQTNGTRLVLVVSAAAGETDRLTREISNIPNVPQHIIDSYVATGERCSAAMVAAAICAAGREAEVVPPSLLFYCDKQFGDAEVLAVNPDPILERLERGVVPVVPGFIGRSSDGRDCLLGRGGSDYSAVLLGAAMQASVVLMKNDCDGIYTADPNADPNARRHERLTHTEALSIAQRGAKVLNGKAARHAMQSSVTVVVRSTFSNGGGTIIASDHSNTMAKY